MSRSRQREVNVEGHSPGTRHGARSAGRASRRTDPSSRGAPPRPGGSRPSGSCSWPAVSIRNRNRPRRIDPRHEPQEPIGPRGRRFRRAPEPGQALDRAAAGGGHRLGRQARWRRPWRRRGARPGGRPGRSVGGGVWLPGSAMAVGAGVRPAGVGGGSGAVVDRRPRRGRPRRRRRRRRRVRRRRRSASSSVMSPTFAHGSSTGRDRQDSVAAAGADRTPDRLGRPTRRRVRAVLRPVPVDAGSRWTGR